MLAILFAALSVHLFFISFCLLSFWRQKGRVYLGIFTGLFALYAVYQFVFHARIDALMLWMEPFNVPLILALIPAFYAYVAKNCCLKVNWFRLLLPAFLFFIFNLFLYLHLTHAEKLIYAYAYFVDYQNNLLLPALFYGLGIFILLNAQSIYYFPKIFLLIQQHQNYLKANFSNLQHISLSWLNAITALFLLAVLFAECLIFYPNVITFGIFIGIIFLVFSLIFAIELHQKNVDIENVTIQNTVKVSLQDQTKLLAQLDAYLQQSKIYLQPDVTLQEIALALGTNRSYLSKALMQSAYKGFYNCLNRYRIDHAKQLLIEKKVLNFSDLSFAAGFGSTSTFYRIFTKLEGITPKRFLQLLPMDVSSSVV